MQGRKPLYAYALSMAQGAIPLMRGECIPREHPIRANHDPIANHLRNDGGRADAGFEGVTVNNRGVREVEPEGIPAINEQIGRLLPSRKVCHRALHCALRRSQNPQCVNEGSFDNAHPERDAFRQKRKRTFPLLGSHLLRICNADSPREPSRLFKDTRSGDHGTRKRSPPRFIKTSNDRASHIAIVGEKTARRS